MFGMEDTILGEDDYYLNHPAVKALWTSVTISGQGNLFKCLFTVVSQ